MNFKPELVEKILAGEKTETRRIVSNNPHSPWFRHRCAVEPGRDYAVCPGRGKPQVARIRVRAVERVTLRDVDGDAAKAEGFRSLLDFRDYWARLHGSIDLNTEVWAIAFSLIPTEGGGNAASD